MKLMERPSDDPRLPPEIIEQYSAWAFTPVSIHPGRSVMYRLSRGAESRLLKVVRKGSFPSAEGEAQRTIWARAHVPVPEILQLGVTADTTWFLARAIEGDDATHERFRSDVPALVRRIAVALRHFHSMPVDACPFSFRLDASLQHAEKRLRDGEIDPARDFHSEHANLSADAAVRKLIATRPATEDVVVCHGDCCVPNILFHGNTLAGFVDLGELGTADRWWDLAVATWSLTWNFGPGHEPLFLDAYGVELDEPRSRYYRLLYDVVS
jgi:kanamycin kinase